MDRVAGIGHHDWDPFGRVLRCLRCRGGRRQQCIHIERNEFGGKCWEPIRLACSKTSINDNVLSLDPTTFPQSLQEGFAPIVVVKRCKAAAGQYARTVVEIPDAPDPRLLRPRRERV